MTFAFTLAECRLLYDVVARGRADRAEGRDPGPLEDVVRSEHRRLHGVSGYDPSPDKLLAKLAALSPDEVRELQRACLRVLA